MLLWYWGRRGGGAQFALSLARAMVPNGLTLSVSRQGELVEAFRALPVPRQEVCTYTDRIGFAAGLGRVPQLAAALRRFAVAEDAPVVLSAMSHPWTSLVAPSLARAGLAYVPVIHDAVPHPGDPGPLFQWRLDRELAAARAAVVLSNAVASKIAARRPDLPLIRLSMGAHLPYDTAPAATPRSDFLFFGRLRHYKGLDLLRNAWPRLRAIRPDARLRVVGEGNAEACAPGLARLPGVDVEQRWVPDAELAPLIASTRALVLPYREASQSGVLPLALALGVPVVATAVGGLPEQVEDGKAGLVSAPTPDAIAAAMLQLLDPATYDRLASGARRAGTRLRDWSQQAQHLRTGLDAVLAK
ncbi:glycosyltransferase family 4 protein [Paracraurococcus lichenis]|uniref:Glycosyltransferase family 4 protein n=1 Tax=Paracraurococcus lichenis TaxID=3064888 RepID=A0ABT9EAB0_9PROT|nr:glycosyltransferase family 4 protein [Paracraurococcus sp. LOR1-02]MDO9713143.1 glycosyltransferase family 4 protein [Paracraurococcus sp. LOR1-02]